MHLRLLTFNVWALPVCVPGSDRDKRLAAIPSAIEQCGADLVFLQEAFHPGTRRSIVKSLKQYEAGPGALNMRRLLGFLTLDCTGGLVTLSRMPVLETQFTPHELPSMLPERIGRKGVLRSRVATPLGEMDVFNIHLCAGRKKEHTAIRLSQLEVLSRQLGETQTDLPILLAGDFNAAPGRDESDFLRGLGFRDTMEDRAAVTYSVSGNPYAALWYNEVPEDQRFDYILYRESPKYSLTVERVSVVFDGKPLSDHYGLLAEVTIGPRSEN